MKRALFALLLVTMPAAHAGTWQRDNITYNSGRYTIDMAMRVDAPYENVHAALTDYNHLTRLSPAMTESVVLTTKPLVIRTVMHDCFLFFCTDLTNTQDITEPEPGHVMATTEPAHSNLTYGTTEWRMVPVGKETLVMMHAEMEPDFWVPPLIGPAIIKARMREQAETALGNVERVAGGS